MKKRRVRTTPVIEEQDSSDQNPLELESNASVSESSEKNSFDTTPRRQIHGRMTPDKATEARKLLAEGRSTRSIADSLDLGIHTVQRFVRKINPVEPGAPLQDWSPKRMGRPPKDDNRLRSSIEAIVTADNTLTLRGIVDLLPDTMKVSESAICRVLRRMGYSRRRVQDDSGEQNSEVVLKERQDYAKEMLSLADADVVFLDETGLNLRVSTHYGYAPVDAVPTQGKPSNAARSLTVLLALRVNGIAAHEIIEGSFETAQLIAFVKDKLVSKLDGKKPIVVVDKVRLQPHLEQLSSVLQESGLKLRFLPPCSPEMNPVEGLIAQLNRDYHAYRPRPYTVSVMTEVIQSFLQTMSKNSMEQYFRRTKEWLEKVRQLQPFT